MIIRRAVRPLAGLVSLLVVSMVTLPAHAACAPQARLVHCGQTTCLRLAGHRQHPAVTVRIAGQELAVAGGRAWAVTVPVATAREWQRRFGDTLTVAFFNPATRSETTQDMVLPPGALGRRVELASLVVSAR